MMSWRLGSELRMGANVNRLALGCCCQVAVPHESQLRGRLPSDMLPAFQGQRFCEVVPLAAVAVQSR